MRIAKALLLKTKWLTVSVIQEDKVIFVIRQKQIASMKIQLLTQQNKVLYEIEKSELFPDYRSVLIEAIAYNIDLRGLFIESECIDGIVWKGVNMNGVTIKNASMRRAKLIECYGKNINFDNCDLTGLKVKKSELNGLHVLDSNLTELSFINSCSKNSFIDESNCSKALFYESNIEATMFHTCNISETVFQSCCLDATDFIHFKPSRMWMRDTYLIDCSTVACKMNYVDDISLLYFWEINTSNIQFKKNERFTNVENTHSKIIYAIDSDTVWWKPHVWNSDVKKIFRGTLEQFSNEVQNGFPTTDLYPEMDDFEIESELFRVCQYLKSWRQTEKDTL